jgi:hypothetical protein
MNTFNLYRALEKRAFLFLILSVFSFSGCAIKNSRYLKIKDNFSINRIDYINHFEHLAKDYLKSPKNQDYLKEIYKRIVVNNELILKKDINPTFHIIKSPLPFYFSLPSGRFFFSDTLIKKYLKSENLFVSLIATEIYRVHKELYEKKILIPVGYLNTKKMLSLYKLPIDVRVESLKWTYFLLKRSGYDPYAVLNWLQMQNKNSLEFSIQLGTSHARIREEFLFKSFLALEVGKKQVDSESTETNSSQGFYRLQRSLL